jgi:hypothetical protein
MTTQNDHASKLNRIVLLVGDELRTLNYVRSKRLFNRLQPDGIVHVIDFQMGQNWSILWGKFTVEIGIFIPEVYTALHEKAAPKFITSPYCVERERLGVLSKDRKDIWWDLTGNEIVIGNEVSNLLLECGEPYLARFRSRKKLLAQWEQERLQRRLSERNVLIMAIILSHGGEKKEANELLDTEFGNQYKTAFLEYAQNVVVPLGLSFPVLK